MNILIVTPYFPPQTGGVVTFTDDLQRLLRKRGHNVSVITPSSCHSITQRTSLKESFVYDFYFRTPWVPEFPIRGFLAFIIYFIPTLLKLKKFLKEKAINLVALEYPMAFMGYFALLKAWVRVKLIVGIHGSDILSLTSAPKYEQRIVKQLVRHSDWLLAHSSSLLSQAKAIVGQLGENCSHIPYGIELERWQALAKSNSLLLRQEILSQYVLTVAKLHSRKGIDALLRSIEQIKDSLNGCRFVIIGDGPDEENLKNLALQLRLDKVVHFTGELQREEIRQFYQSCEFFVLPSRSEPFGIVLLEAMAFSKAIIATKVGGIPEFIVDGINGILVPPDDGKALAESIVRLLRDSQLRAKIGENGRRIVEKQYSYSVIIDKYEQLFTMLIP